MVGVIIFMLLDISFFIVLLAVLIWNVFKVISNAHILVLSWVIILRLFNLLRDSLLAKSVHVVIDRTNLFIVIYLLHSLSSKLLSVIPPGLPHFQSLLSLLAWDEKVEIFLFFWSEFLQKLGVTVLSGV